MSIKTSCIRPRQHLTANCDYTNSKPVAIAWLVIYVLMVGGGLVMKPAAKQGAEVVAHVADALEQQ